jgi:hypothetical protein
MRWQVKGIPIGSVNKQGGSMGEPFAAIQLKTGTIVLVKENVFYEGDEPRSSTKVETHD